MMIGKNIRLERIINRQTRRTVIVPMDHGVTIGPISGLIDMKQAVNTVVEGGANAIVVHKGIVRAGHRQSGKDIGLIIHMSASTVMSPDPTGKVLVCTVEEALRKGADGVSIHVNLGAPTEDDMLNHLGEVSRGCEEWGMPLLAMMYTRGAKLKSESEPAAVSHAARIAAELGADIVKVTYTGSAKSFRSVVEGCPIPVLIAGGEKADSDRAVFEAVRGALDAGGAGVCMGRNAFQHRNPLGMMRAIGAMVHENATPQQAAAILAGRSLKPRARGRRARA